MSKINVNIIQDKSHEMCGFSRAECLAKGNFAVRRKKMYFDSVNLFKTRQALPIYHKDEWTSVRRLKIERTYLFQILWMNLVFFYFVYGHSKHSIGISIGIPRGV